MKSETEIAAKLLDVQGEIDHLFINFGFRLKELPEVAKVRLSHGWHNPNFRQSVPTFYACLGAWKSSDEGVEFSWVMFIRLEEEKWTIRRKVTKQYRSGNPEGAIDFSTLEANSLDDLKSKVTGATNELIESAHSVGFHIPASEMTTEIYKALNQVSDDLEAIFQDET